MTSKSNHRSLVKPPALRVGDTVALIRPSTRLDEKLFSQAVATVRRSGLCVAVYPGKFQRDTYFSASEKSRSEEFDWAFLEPGIKAVLACRGGYGAERMLAEISPTRWKKYHPRIFVGYSDCTFLHQWIQNELGWVSYHGPLIGFLRPQSTKKFLKSLFELPSIPSKESWKEITNIGAASAARGRLVGGNLSMLRVLGKAALPRTPMILLIEEVNENFYRIDRMLWTLIDAGYSKFVKGIIFGTLEGCGKSDRKTFGLKRVHQTLQRLTRGPIWMNARVGHGLSFQRIVPLGCEVRMRGKTLEILEGMVSES